MAGPYGLRKRMRVSGSFVEGHLSGSLSRAVSLVLYPV